MSDPASNPVETCTHPDDRIEWRKWPSTMGPPKFGPQCLDCLEPVGRLVPKRKVPLQVDTATILLRKYDVKAERRKRGATGLGGRGNSRRRKYEAFLKTRRWAELREHVLERDQRRCQDCGAPANTAAHIRYPADIRDTRPEDLKASCVDCNQAEREQRHARAVLGG